MVIRFSLFFKIFGPFQGFYLRGSVEMLTQSAGIVTIVYHVH